MEDIIQEFVAETSESLDQLDADLVELEKNPKDSELIANIFRVLHTIKGTSGFLGLDRLGKVAHKGEDVLGLLRDEVLEVTPEYITLILASLDTIKEIIEEIEKTGSEPEGDDSELITKLEAVYNGQTQGEGAEKSQEEKPAEIAIDELPDFDSLVVPEDEPEENPKEEVKTPPCEAENKEKATANKTKKPETAQTLRVNVGVLENLMTMVSELVLTRNQLMQIARQSGHEGDIFAAPLQNLNSVVSELQDGVMKTRMQPIGNAWQKLPRIIRDVSSDLGKKIDLKMFGQDTELDRQVLEMIKDPLTHMVRNSADHGIETPDVRLACGKPEVGVVELKAYHQGGHIIVEISDDGKGLPMDKIKEKILSQGLVTPEQLNEMSDQKIQQYIFHAGLSTAEKITAVSGRGVGMDVVRTNIEKIGGSIELTSEEGKGSTFMIKIPLTLAIVSALIVGANESRFAIPQLSVSELVLVDPDEAANPIEEINGAKVLRLRDQLLPLVSLSDLLEIKTTNEAETEQRQHYVVVTSVGNTTFGIVVDEVYDLEEIVIKPLSSTLKEISVFSGNTILGDGCVIMILDPAGILKSIETAQISGTSKNDEEEELAEREKTLLLLFRAGDETLKAVPIENIARLEEVYMSDITKASGIEVVQHLGHLLPIQDWSNDADLDHVPKKKPMIIMRHNGKSVGLVANQILDVAPYYGQVEVSNSNSISNSVIINDTATDVVNVASITENGINLNEASNG